MYIYMHTCILYKVSHKALYNCHYQFNAQGHERSLYTNLDAGWNQFVCELMSSNSGHAMISYSNFRLDDTIGNIILIINKIFRSITKI